MNEEELQKIRSDNWFLFFDKMKNYNNYFPHNNAENVIIE